MEFEGYMMKETFRHYSLEELIPKLDINTTVIMDNLSSHRACQDLFEQHNINVLFLPPYTPEYNPIEMLWEKIKRYLRKNRSKNMSDLMGNVTLAYQTITIQDIRGWFIHSGYLCS